MPIYEYKCGACGVVFEVMQKFSDKPVKKCAHCGAKKAEKIISQSSFVLKGSGWYKTDYAAKEKKCGKDPEKSLPKPECSGCPSNG